MAPQAETTLPATRRARKSIGAGPSTRKALDKENATLDVGNGTGGARKKSRSKSMGPGGLDPLKMGNGNRRASLAVPTPRSILKPTIPPLPEIPSYKPHQTPGGNGVANDAGGTKVALRTEEEQQAAAREREERERAQLEKEIKERRDARRKSLANRRVSFAAEATLHTFHDIEEMQDSTTSTDSTRRQQQQQDSNSDLPSTPPDDIEEHAGESPANQRDLHQRKRRRSSAASSMYGSDDTIGSTVYDSDSENADSVTEIHAMEMEGSSDEDGTIMTVEAEEMTSASTVSPRSAYEGDTSASLDENLRLAARRAVTQSIDEDEEVIAGFAGWGRKNPSQEVVNQSSATESHASPGGAADPGSDTGMDMDLTSAVGGVLYPQLPSPDKDDEINEDLSMDVTTALGGILSKAKAFLRGKSVNQSPQTEQSESGEQTMELTTAVGGIRQGRVSEGPPDDTEINEDMSMEFTTAVGGLLSGGRSKDSMQSSRRQTLVAEAEDGDGAAMDMTVSVGRILPAEAEEDEEDQTMGMDMTVAVGGVINSTSTPEARSAARRVMEQEADEPHPSITATPERATSPKRSAASGIDENAPGPSPFRGQSLRRTPPPAVSPVAGSPAQPSSSPMKLTPSPQRNIPQAQRSPTRTPPSVRGSRSSSPMRNLSSPFKTTPRSVAKSLFRQDPNTGLNTPRVVLTPQGRRLSGVGADRPGLGSPRVAEIFDRRESIGRSASNFVPSQPANPRRNVAFADPRELEAEINKDEQVEHGTEDSRGILEQEVDGSQDDQEGTANLMQMIHGLSPKKNPLRGRKSLHVGSARGLLGKRPAELDDEDDDSEEPDGVKRLKGHQGSPVKNIRLQSPPSKAETTTGRKTRPSIRPTEHSNTDNATLTLERSPQRATTPRDQGRFRSVFDDQPTTTFDFNDATQTMDAAATQRDDDGDRIHLRDFLNMTSIRFMELTTTKRRHTVAPGASKENAAAGAKDDLSLERCVVAGACTVPMLELYQHSCRELKKYISEGRRIVREIETETFEDNPPLFKEYMTASPEFRVLMDNQFKNVKTHARLLSKAMWYEWRMKLQDGLKEGLVKIAEGMDNDDQLLAKQQELLSSALPDMVKRLEALELEHADLEAVARELADCDPQDLEDARAELAAVDKSMEEKTRKLQQLRQELDESVQGLESLSQQKQQYLEEIREADKIREECRGWSAEEIRKHKAQTDAMENQYGWSIFSIAGTTITMRYKREIELVFDLALPQQQQRQQQKPASPIQVRYIAETPSPCPPEKEFFLHHIRERLLRCVQQQQKKNTPPAPRRILDIVSSAWDKAGAVTEHVRRLNLSFPTAVAAVDDGSVRVTASVLLVPLQTRVEAVMRLEALATADGGPTDGSDDWEVEMTVTPEVRVVYGEQFNTGKMTSFLAGRIGNVVGREVEVSWDVAVLELYGKLLAKGKQRE
ncbi:hypothetical protein C7999DRAFT_28609 [Corynascus novoguineensis]|uniref:Spc7 kinetochore protein domain-containing protein n=1 Tax=Corynascus novoguineensis TaxID=1126955 RepID=A0AAN7CZC8_9PEZI|nr:hypothetical protein C7999DRAFT_28609 [Corynascus novoguineensis]